MGFKQKSSPFQRNFGIGKSPVKQTSPMKHDDHYPWSDDAPDGHTLLDHGKDVASSVGEGIEDVYKRGKDIAGEVYKGGKRVISDIGEFSSDALESAQDLLDETGFDIDVKDIPFPAGISINNAGAVLDYVSNLVESGGESLQKAIINKNTRDGSTPTAPMAPGSNITKGSLSRSTGEEYKKLLKESKTQQEADKRLSEIMKWDEARESFPGIDLAVEKNKTLDKNSNDWKRNQNEINRALGIDKRYELTIEEPSTTQGGTIRERTKGGPYER